MKRTLLLGLALLFPVAMPLPYTPVAHAQPPKSRNKQIQAIDLWAGVIRRGKTAQVMYECADLLTEICYKIDHDQSMFMELNFRVALHYMKSATSMKAKGLDRNNRMMLDVAEQTIKQGQQRVRQD